MEDGTENIFTCDACRYTFAANKNTEQCPDCGKFAVRGASAEEIENYRKIQIEIAHTLGSDPMKFSYILNKYVDLAKEEHPSLIPETVSPHGLRHSKSMHMLQAGVPLIYIRDFLGHSEISTTEIYARCDSEQKRKAIEAACLNITVRQVAQRAPE